MARQAILMVALVALAGCEPGQGVGFGPAAPGAPPPGVDEADLAVFRAAVAEAGCQVTGEQEAAVVEARTGLDPAQLGGVVEYLAGQGELVQAPDGTGFVLATGACAGVALRAG